ncbi:hypothetical protein [Marinicella pacifica]|uniref:beta strand repeat-containing protein n=1 Tax=Marinicella pacifica TaxID=1171543 RepID=UPI0031EDA271
MKKSYLLAVTLLTASMASANNTPHDLSSGPFLQDWSNPSLITSNDDWSGVPSIEGFQGGGLVSGNNVDPQTVLTADDPGTFDVFANETNPDTLNSGGVAEFDTLANPVVAFQGSGTADAPYLQIYLNTTGRQDIRVQYLLRDVDGSNNDSVQQVGLHYRVGSSGTWTNLPGGYVADASTGPNLSTATFPIDVTLPVAANNQAVVQLRVMTTNASGSDEFIGVDDINISSNPTATPVVATAVVDNNVSINGGNDGQATASGSGGVPPYTYAWSDGQTTATATNLIAGVYSVTVTDNNGGNDAASVTITEPTAVVATAVVDNNVSVNGGNDGQATASGSGGVPPYTYAWSDGQTTATATNLIAGVYSVTVTDNNGGNDAASVTITEPTAVVATAVVDNNVSVNGGNDGQATASGSGGVPPYTYAWSDGQTTATATNLIAGVYSVTVTDNNGGTDATSVTITEPTPLTATITNVVDESVPGAADGSATVSASGGVPPYSYLWSNGGTTATINGLTAGSYTVTVTDDNGATASPAAAVVGVTGSLPPTAVPSNATWSLIFLSIMIVLLTLRRRFSH